jgi:hypothetical protein
MNDRRRVGTKKEFKCETCGTLLKTEVPNRELFRKPMDIYNHHQQRGVGHSVIEYNDPIYEDGGPTFARGDIVVKDLDLRPDMEYLVIGTLDDRGKEWVGLLSVDYGLSFLQLAERLMLVEHKSGEYPRITDPRTGYHYNVVVEYPTASPIMFLSKVEEFPMMWHTGLTPRIAIENLIKEVREHT